MRLTDVQIIGEELALKWEDGTEHFLKQGWMRRGCPCAGCQGERDIMGNLYKSPEKPLSAEALVLRRWSMVGGYAIRPVWGDGHQTGLYSFDYLRRLAEAQTL